ncbi:hypothetical protein RRG08_039054 [Elysia crispata]|uniref:Uncharacterized protein n=1 Tax=Elysia crispata TaxID=231223 RepID=A0AAE1DTF9_9GAST|nr:hypothetical protein RRG08_039054 [Elysia crispata]
MPVRLNTGSQPYGPPMPKKLSHVAHVSKQLTMMKRRVLKKVVTRRGEEIICDVTPSPTLSRQSSVDQSDASDEERRKAGARTISREAAKSSGRIDQLSVSAKEKHPTPKKSPRRADKNKPAPEQTTSASRGSLNSANSNADNKTITGDTTSADGFASIVSLAMQTASGGKAPDKQTSSQSEQVSCPIKLEVTQYETESDGSSSDAKTRTATLSGDGKVKNNISKARNSQKETLNISVSQASEPACNKSASPYNPRALCSKRPPSLPATKSTSSSLSSFDKLSYTDVASVTKVQATTTTEPAVASITASESCDKTGFPRVQSPSPEENKPKFTASNIVGTFLDSLSQGKKSGLIKSGSLPLPNVKAVHPLKFPSGRSDSDARGDIVSPGSAGLDLKITDIEGETTISQLQRFKQRTMSVSSQSSSSSYPTRNPSRNVSPSPSRAGSPPSRSISPSRSRNVSRSPSPSPSPSPSHSVNISIPDSRKGSPSCSRDAFAAVSSNVFTSSSKNGSPNQSMKESSSDPRNSYSLLPPQDRSPNPFHLVSPSESKDNSTSHSRETSPSRSQVPPNTSPARLKIDSSNQADNDGSFDSLCFQEKAEISKNSRGEAKGPPIDQVRMATFLSQVSFSTTETRENGTSRRTHVVVSSPGSLRSLKELSSQLRPSEEDNLPVRDVRNQQPPLKTLISEKGETLSWDADGTIDNTSSAEHGNPDSHERLETNDRKSYTSEDNNDNKNHRSEIKSLFTENLSENFPDEGIGVSSSSNSNTEEQPENKMGNPEPTCVNLDVSMEDHKKRHAIYVADHDEQDLIGADLDFDVLTRRRGSASFDFSDYKPRHKITWSQHRSFSQERKLRKSLSCPSQSMGGLIALAKDRIRSPMSRKRSEVSPHLEDCSSTSESGEEAKTRRERFGKEEGTRNSETKDAFSETSMRDHTSRAGESGDKNASVNQYKGETETGNEGSVGERKRFISQTGSSEKANDSGHDNGSGDVNMKRQKDARTTKYHIQLLSASDMKSKDSGATSLTHTWSSSRRAGKDSFGKLRRKTNKGFKSLSVSEARQVPHPYFFSLGDDPGSDVHSDDLFSRGKTDQMLVTGSSSPTSSCASASAAVGSNNVIARTSSLRRGRLARSKKWNTFDGDSIGSHQASLSITGANMSVDQALESGHSSGGGSDGTGQGDDTATSSQMLHLMNSLKRRRASEGIGLKAAEDHEDEEGDEEDDEVLQIVIESKVLEYSNSPRRGNHDEFGNDDDEESVLPQSLTSGPTGDHSSLTYYESNAPTSVENSPLSHLGAPAVLPDDLKNIPSGIVSAQKVADQLGFLTQPVSPLSGLSNRSDNSDWSEDDLLTARGDQRTGDFGRRTQEDRVRGDWSPRLVDFSCRSENPQLKNVSTSMSGIEASSITELQTASSDMASLGCEGQDINTAALCTGAEATGPHHSLAHCPEPNVPQHRMASSQDCGGHQRNLADGETCNGPQKGLMGTAAGINADIGESNEIIDTRSTVQSKIPELHEKSLSIKNTSAFKASGFVKNVKDLELSLATLNHADINHAQSQSDKCPRCVGTVEECESCRLGVSARDSTTVASRPNDVELHRNFAPDTMAQTGESFKDRSIPTGSLPSTERETSRVSLRIRKIPIYGHEGCRTASNIKKTLLAPSLSGEKPLSPSRNVMPDVAEHIKSKPLKPSSLETNRSGSPSVTSPRISSFFSNLSMLSPTASVCANMDSWSTPSKSYTISDSDLLSSQDHSLSGDCSICEELKHAWRNSGQYEAEADDTGYFQEKTLTPTKYRQMSNIFNGGFAKPESSTQRRQEKKVCKLGMEAGRGTIFKSRHPPRR